MGTWRRKKGREARTRKRTRWGARWALWCGWRMGVGGWVGWARGRKKNFGESVCVPRPLGHHRTAQAFPPCTQSHTPFLPVWPGEMCRTVRCVGWLVCFGVRCSTPSTFPIIITSASSHHPPPLPPPHPTGHSDSRDQANGAVCERAGVRGQQPQGGQCPLRAGQNGRGGWGWGRGRRRRRRRRGGQVPAQPGEWERGLVQVDEVCLGKTRDGGSESQRIQVDEWGGAGMGGRHRSAAAGPPPLNSFSHTHTRMHLKFHP